MIGIEQIGDGDSLEFDVRVGEGRGATVHRVTLARLYLQELSVAGEPPARIVEAAFHFLLDREPKEAIMRRFDLPVIARYFPEFEAKLPDYVARLGGSA